MRIDFAGKVCDLLSFLQGNCIGEINFLAAVIKFVDAISHCGEMVKDSGGSLIREGIPIPPTVARRLQFRRYFK